jgi:superfamily II DNA or RNA helicase
MHKYQFHTVDFIKEKKRAMLLLSMGMGKTVSTLTAISDLIDSFCVNKVSNGLSPITVKTFLSI